MKSSACSLLLLVLVGCTKPADRVVAYTAQDREYAEPVYTAFAASSELGVAPKFDTEANKAVGLAAELVQEKGLPRADVHWNNEILNAIRLSRQGVYAEYESPAAADFPPWTRPANKHWQALAARARVLIVNTNLVTEADRPESMFDLLDAKWKGKLCTAKPQFGTTATHAACLFEVLGADAAKDYYRGLKKNEIGVVAGNKQVAVGVAKGEYAMGFTDTDDALIELNSGKPVALVFPDRGGHAKHPRLGVLYIPNTVALVANGPNPTGGKKLIDHILSSEAQLAAAGGFQVPLNPRVSAALPPALPRPESVARMAVDFERAADLWDDVQSFLRDEFAR